MIGTIAGGLISWHAREHGVLNLTQALLAVFCGINSWVCMCEISLLVHCLEVQRLHAEEVKLRGEWTLPPNGECFLLQFAPLSEILTLKYWAQMWSFYSALDPAYIDTASFGFNIDVGNGTSTLIPTVLFAVCMTVHDVLPPVWLGMIGLIFNYQMMYGTFVYFFQYFFNTKHKHLPVAHWLGIVVPTNGLWIPFPALGMYASARLILDRDFSVFLNGADTLDMAYLGGGAVLSVIFLLGGAVIS